MINFKKITSKNFMSIGDNQIELSLNEHHIMGVRGTNGSGKSCFTIDAMTFALFGKSFRGVTKASLINTTNKSGTLVVLEFDVNGSDYKVSRGIKPDVFTIEKGGVGLDESASSKDMQSVLDGILGFDYSMFTKTIGLGYANHVPFMTMDAKQRREFVESALGVSKFSDMNKKVKAEATTINADLVQVSNKMNAVSAKIDAQLESNKHLQTSRTAEIESVSLELADIQTRIESGSSDVEKIKLAIDKVGFDASAYTSIIQRKSKLSASVDMAKSSLVKCNTQYKSFEKAESCPTCGNEMNKEHRLRHMNELEANITKLEESIYTSTGMFEGIDAELTALEESKAKYEKLKVMLVGAESLISNLRGTKTRLDSQLVKLNTKSELFDVTPLQAQLADLEKENTELLEKQTSYKYALELLKDTGIKAGIIKRYIPILNQQTNKMLDIIGFGVRVQFDEEFNETLIGRYSDEFTYKSLSQGERERLNLALLFAWGEVMKMASGIDSSLLVIDEIGSSALDGDGVSAMFDLIESTHAGKNCIIISHNQEAINVCDKVIRVKKLNGFTKIVE